MRIILLASLTWIIGLTEPVFAMFDYEVSWRDLILLAGGMFLIAKGTWEIHQTVEGNEERREVAPASFVNVVTQIMVLDNAEAEQHVGQEVPFRTGEYAQVGQVPGAVNPFTTIQREPVGTTLTITPQINEGTGMILSIQLEQSSIAPGAQGAADLITNTRRIATEVFAEDGEIIVLGGLIDDQLRQNEQRVPGLGRIPGIGWLFRARRTERSRTNMMMFIRPVILRDSVQRYGVTSEKYEFFRQLQLEQAERPVRLMREETPPLLPEIQPPPAQPSDAEEPNANDGN